MLYEEYMDDDYVRQSILDRMPDEYDKRDGTPFEIIARAVATPISQLFITNSIDYDESFADTASYSNLARRMKERGLELYPATKALFKCVVLPNTLVIPQGTRLQLANEQLLYHVTRQCENITINSVEYAAFEIELQEDGSEYNNIVSGNLIFIDNDVDGCKKIQLHSLVQAGEDTENEDLARNRYFESFKDKRFGGNISDYKSYVSAQAGISGCRVYRPGEWTATNNCNIKVTCISSANKSISQELVSSLQTALYPHSNADGTGWAPIGHRPLVCSVEETQVNLQLDLEYADGYSFNDVKSGIETNVSTLLNGLCATWSTDADNSHDGVVIRIANLITQISMVEGVLDVNSIKINSNTVNTNLTLSSDQIPVIGTVSEVV